MTIMTKRAPAAASPAVTAAASGGGGTMKRSKQPGKGGGGGRQRRQGTSVAKRKKNKKTTIVVLLATILLSMVSILMASHFLLWTISIGGGLRQYSDSSSASETAVSSLPHSSEEEQDSQQQQQNRSSMLRFDWTSLQLHSPLARRISSHQSNCSLPLADFRYRNKYGLGSDLHLWTQAMCNGLERGLRLRTESDWLYLDQSDNNVCSGSASGGSTTNYRKRIKSSIILASAMECYFPKSELQCPNDRFEALNVSAFTKRPKLYMGDGVPDFRGCKNFTKAGHYRTGDIRAAGIEYLFTKLSNTVVKEAERQLVKVFAPNASYTKLATNNAEDEDNDGSSSSSSSNGSIVGKRFRTPSNLITVHIRWGDKSSEMKLVPVSMYVDAVDKILIQRRQKQKSLKDPTKMDYSTNPVNIFLATEDPDAVHQFVTLVRSTKRNNWNVYVDSYFQEFEKVRKVGTHNHALMARELNGRSGLVALGSLLVAMEANDYVLTTKSNWSRLMNELRKNVINPQCNDCTTMIDLRPGEL